MQITEFLTLNRKLSLAMFPIIHFQLQVQSATFGQTAWRRVSARVNGVFQERTTAEIFAAMADCSMSITPDH